MTHSREYVSLIRKILLQGFLTLSLLMIWSVAQAQTIERIEINRKGQEAEIRIRFAVQFQYINHTPPDEGKLLRVFIRLTSANLPESSAVQETLKSPDTDMVPRFTVTYPDVNDVLLITFAQSTRYKVRPDSDSRSILITVPILPGAKDFVVEQHVTESAKQKTASATLAPVLATPSAEIAAAPVPAEAPTKAKEETTPSPPVQAATEAGVAPPVLSAAEVENLAKKFMNEARQAIAKNDAPTAVNRLYRTLGLPSNSQTQAAQALIGEAREMNGEYAKARAEYALYLKLFPSGAEVPHIKDRLAKLPKAPTSAAKTEASKALRKDEKPAEWLTTASISQYRYLGNSHIETITPPPPGQLVFNVDTLSMTDQNSLISTFDINARKRDSVTDTRIVVRDTDNKNFLPGRTGYNRLYSAYFEQTDKALGYFVRAGRQNPNGGGVMDRFDGLALGYNFGNSWRVNGVAGSAVEFLSPFNKKFYSVSLDMLPQVSEPGVSAYYTEQTLDGELNRRAIGAEARYFDSQTTVYSMLDYDLLFNGLNIFLLQGNYLAQDGSNYYAILDRRRTPSFGLTNAMSASPGLSIQDMIATLGIDEVRRQAKTLTAISNMFSLGATYPFSPQWQLGADYRISSVSGTDEAGSMPAQPGTGNNHVVTFRAIGNNLLLANDVGVADASLIHAPTYNGQAYGLSYVILLQDAWRIDGNLHYYTQKDNNEETQKRLTPTIKLSYRWKDSVSLEAEVGQETSKIDGPLRVENAKRNYMYFGYRWDIR